MTTVTMRQVAKHAGVSVATVSYVLSNDRRITAETRARVVAAIKELDYHPNSFAQGLARKQADIVGLFMPRPRSADPFLLEFISGVMDVTARRHVGMLLLHPGERPDDVPRELLGQRVSGVIVLESQAYDPRVDWLTRKSIPFVLFGRCQNEGVKYWLDVDNVAGARMAVDHLAGMGRRRIAFISAPLQYMFAQFRLEGYLEGIRANGLAHEQRFIMEGDLSEESGYAVAKLLLQQPDPPTAILAASDIMATGALRAAKEVGLQVPGDVAVIGFDGTQFSAYTNPPLTTVRQPIYDIGRQAAEMLLTAVTQPDAPNRWELIQPSLVVRASCGA